MAVVAEEVVVCCVEVAVFFAGPAERGVPRSEDRELGFRGVRVNFTSCVFAYAVVHCFMAGETSKGIIRRKIIGVKSSTFSKSKPLKRRRSTVLAATSAIGTSLTSPPLNSLQLYGGSS